MTGQTRYVTIDIFVKYMSVADMLGRNKAEPAPAGGQLSDEMRARIVDHLTCKGTKPFPGKTKMARGDANQKFYQALIAFAEGKESPYTIGEPPLMVYGHPVSKIAFNVESWELLFMAYLPNLKKEALIKAAGLKPAKDSSYYYGPFRKDAGTLTLREFEGVWTLSCSLDTGAA